LETLYEKLTFRQFKQEKVAVLTFSCVMTRERSKLFPVTIRKAYEDVREPDSYNKVVIDKSVPGQNIALFLAPDMDTALEIQGVRPTAVTLQGVKTKSGIEVHLRFKVFAPISDSVVRWTPRHVFERIYMTWTKSQGDLFEPGETEEKEAAKKEEKAE
jgi:hypothetical protein